MVAFLKIARTHILWQKSKLLFLKINSVFGLLLWPDMVLVFCIIWPLTPLWHRSLSFRNQSIDPLCKSMESIAHDRDLHHKGVKSWLWKVTRQSGEINWSTMTDFHHILDSLLLCFNNAMVQGSCCKHFGQLIRGNFFSKTNIYFKSKLDVKYF